MEYVANKQQLELHMSFNRSNSLPLPNAVDKCETTAMVMNFQKRSIPQPAVKKVYLSFPLGYSEIFTDLSQ